MSPWTYLIADVPGAVVLAGDEAALARRCAAVAAQPDEVFASEPAHVRTEPDCVIIVFAFDLVLVGVSSNYPYF
jgi:hypothetical protein